MSLILRAAEDAEELDGIAGWAVDLMETIGAPGAGLAIALENLFPPLPSEIILPLAGFTASQGDFSLTAALVWTTIGSVAGAIVMYALGAWFGRDRMYRLWAVLPLVKTEDLQRAESFFNRHGRATVFFGRMIPIFRSLISVPAGIERMAMAPFLLFTTAGSLIWNAIFVYAGFALGEQWHRVDEYAGTFQKLVIVVVVLGVCAWVLVRVRSMRSERRA